MRQMPTHEPIHQLFIDLAQRHPLCAKPTREVFAHLGIGLDTTEHMSASAQIQDEAVKYYAQLTGSHSPAHKPAAEDIFDHGDASEPTGSQDPASLPCASSFDKRKLEN
jgi:hypothetical protein